MAAPTADVYPAWKDALGTSIDWDAAGNNLYCYLVANTMTTINASHTSVADFSGDLYDGAGGISAVITTPSSGIYTPGGAAAWSGPTAGTEKFIVLAWDTGTDPTTYANVIPIALLPNAMIPDGNQFTLNPNPSSGWFTLNAGL